MDVSKPSIEFINLREIHRAPQRFQYKRDTDARGVNGRLRQMTKWNPDYAGLIMCLKSIDSQLFVVEGHQRTDLAERCIRDGQFHSIELATNIKREGDAIPHMPDYVWNDQSAMAYAAGVNIVQGTGTILDAARILRVYPEFMPSEFPNDSLARTARGLVPLSSDAFEYLINFEKDVSLQQAAQVPVYLSDSSLHRHALIQLQTARPTTLEAGRQLLLMIAEEGTEKFVQTTMFGNEFEHIDRNHIRMQIYQSACRYLRRERELFRRITKHADRLETCGETLVHREVCLLEEELSDSALSHLQPMKIDRRTIRQQKDTTETSLELLRRVGMSSGELSDMMRLFVTQVAQSTLNIDEAGESYAQLVRRYIHNFLPSPSQDMTTQNQCPEHHNLSLI